MDYRQMCKYGANCYQKNPMHHEKFRHPEKTTEASKENDKSIEDKENDRSVHDMANENNELKEGASGKKEADDDQAPVPKRAKLDDSDKSSSGDVNDSDVKPVSETQCEESVLLPDSPFDMKDNIKQKLLVEMPHDFYLFWDFLKVSNLDHPEDGLLKLCDLKLVGAYDLLAGKIKSRSQDDWLCHYRYYYDPPEFQTVIASATTDFHIGYFRDDPKETPVFVASSSPSELGCKLTQLGDNLFAALYNHITSLMHTAPPTKQSGLQQLKQSLHVFATTKHDLSLEAKTPRMKARDRLKLATTFHGAGMVVPYDKDTQVGYREIPESTASLKRIFKNVVEASSDDELDKALDVLQELVTNVQFANDEGDPGMGLELGLDAFCYGGERLHSTTAHLLGVAYDLLGRTEFKTIVLAHIKKRKQGEVYKIK